MDERTKLPDKVYLLVPHNGLRRVSEYKPSPDIRHRFKDIVEYVPAMKTNVKR